MPSLIRSNLVAQLNRRKGKILPRTVIFSVREGQRRNGEKSNVGAVNGANTPCRAPFLDRRSGAGAGVRDAIVSGVGRGKDELQEAMVVVESTDETRRRGARRLPPGPPHADSRGDDQAPLFLPSPPCPWMNSGWIYFYSSSFLLGFFQVARYYPYPHGQFGTQVPDNYFN